MTTQLTLDTAAPGIVTINGRTLTQLGCIPRTLDGHLSTPTMERLTQSIPGQFGVAAAPYMTVAPRTLTVGVYLYAATLNDRARALESLRRALTGVLEITTTDLPGTVCRMTCTEMAADSDVLPGRPLADSSVPLRLTFVGFDAARYKQVATPFIVTANQPVPVMLGDLESPGQYVHCGAHSGEVVLTWRGASGEVLEECALNGSLASTERWVLDFTRDRLWRADANNTLVNVYGTDWAGGSWFTFSPGDAGFDPRSAPEAWPTFSISTGVGVLYVREAYAY